jgi:hypoxanthine phosphoribosyltransferase
MKVYLPQLYIDEMVWQLAHQIWASEHCFWRVVGIENGGLPVSKPLATILRLPHESIRISCYDGEILRPVPIVSGCPSQSTNNLIVDDLIDERHTINTYDKHFGLEGNAVAVLFWNPIAPKPDFYVEEKPDGWIVFPWEITECASMNV